MNQKLLKHYCLLAILLFCNLANAQKSNDYAEKKKDIDQFFSKILNSSTGGAAIAVVRDGEVVFENAYGMANLEYGIPNTVNTVFHAASLSKQFTAYAILLLEQEGKISLDNDIRTYIPEVPDFGKKITLRHLANHTSGLRDQWRLLHLAGWRADDVILNEDILKLVAQQKELNFEPDSKLMYCNTGFTLLAEVVARVSGKSFHEFTQERIFKPLEMSNSQFYDDYEKIVKNRAYSYKTEEEVTKKSKLSFSTVGATSLFTTVEDLCKWAIHLNTLEQTNEALAKKMNSRHPLNNGELTESAMGQWTGPKYKGLEWFDHSGSDASFRAYFSRFPEVNSAVVILGNTILPEGSASDYALAIADGFLEDYYKKVKTPKRPNLDTTYQSIKLSEEELAKFCGRYWEPYERYERIIKLKKGRLIYDRPNSSQTKLLPVGKNEFKMLDDPNDVSVFFEKDAIGNARMRLNINGKRIVHFLKVDKEFDQSIYAGSYHCPELGSTLTLVYEDSSLKAQLFKHNVAELRPIQKDYFKSTDRHLKKIDFIRDEEGNIAGLSVSNGAVRNVKFWKQKEDLN